MARCFDFAKVERKTLNVTMPDGTLLILHMPQKKIWEKFNNFKKLETDELDVDVFFNAMDDIIAAVLSENSQGKKITKEYIQECDALDFEAKMAFLDNYMDFVTAAQKDPN